MRARRLLTFALLSASSAAALSCSSSDDDTASIGISLGLETDAFDRDPKPTEIIVDNIDLDGVSTELSRASLPVTTLSLGDKADTDVGELLVTATDAAGNVLLKGESLYIQYGDVETQDLSVFVQRVGEMARLPSVVSNLAAPQVQVAAGRYILAASGTVTQFYDLLDLSETETFPTLTRPALSMATFGTAGIIIDDKGATTLDLTDGSQTDLQTPTGGTFAEIAGGDAIVNALDESIYVVGGTRTTFDPTVRVFSVTAAGDVAFLALGTARQGACAAYVPGRGLFVYGGAGTGPSAELIVPTATAGTDLPFPADPVTGCAASALDNSHVLVVGGVGTVADPTAIAPARVFDLSCTTNCVGTPWLGTTPLVRGQAVTVNANAVLVLGDDAMGNSHAYRLTPQSSTEIALRVPARKGSRLVALPNPQMAAVIGGDASIEQYIE